MPVMVTARRQWRRKQSVSLQPRKRRSQSKKVRSKIHTQFCTFFLSPYRTECPGDQILKGHGVPMTQKTRTPELKKTKSVAVNKTGKVEVHITDNQSWSSCHKVASHHEFTSRSAKEPTKKKSLYALILYYTWPLQPKLGAPAVWTHRSMHLSSVMNWGLNFVGN